VVEWAVRSGRFVVPTRGPGPHLLGTGDLDDLPVVHRDHDLSEAQPGECLAHQLEGIGLAIRSHETSVRYNGGVCQDGCMSVIRARPLAAGVPGDEVWRPTLRARPRYSADMKQLIWFACAVLASTGCEKKSDAAVATKPDPAPVAVAPVEPTPTPAPPAAPSGLTTKNGPWGIDVASVKTLTHVRALGLSHVADETDQSREPLMTGELFDVDATPEYTVAAFVPSKGSPDSTKKLPAVAFESVHWFETYVKSNNAVADPRSGLCVDSVCVGAPVMEASRFSLTTCDTYRREMELFFKCQVPGAPMSVLVRESVVKGAKDGKTIKFEKLLAARKSTAPAGDTSPPGPLTIAGFAWEVIPNSWQPLQGCTTDCD
jgi:hypothetical protein